MPLPTGDRADVHDVIALHGHLTDDGVWDRMDEVFAPDVVYDLGAMGGGELRGLDAIREAALALGDRNPVGHHVTNVLVTRVEDGDTVHVRSKGIGIMADGTCGSVVYEDLVRRTPDGWRIARRRVRPRSTPLTP